MMRIGLDAMGGDFAPQVTVQGAAQALDRLLPDTTLVLFGDREALRGEDAFGLLDNPRVELVSTTEVIHMGDHPVKAFSQKTDSSIVRGFAALRSGQIAGFASAGSTGAMMVGSMQVIGQIEGVLRPTIATSFKSLRGGDLLLLDVGLNADGKPEHLVQYGIFGHIYARETLGMARPRVGLLNIGEEREKGNLLTKAAYPMLMELNESDKFGGREGLAGRDGGGFCFVGNVEGNQLVRGEVADVVVCDGFAGNILLKTLEGFYEIFRREGVDSPFVRGLNYENIGGTPVLGINSTVIIGHGCSTALAIKNMILQTERVAGSDMVSQFKQAFS